MFSVGAVSQPHWTWRDHALYSLFCSRKSFVPFLPSYLIHLSRTILNTAPSARLVCFTAISRELTSVNASQMRLFMAPHKHLFTCPFPPGYHLYTKESKAQRSVNAWGKEKALQRDRFKVNCPQSLWPGRICYIFYIYLSQREKKIKLSCFFWELDKKNAKWLLWYLSRTFVTSIVSYYC